MALVTLSEVKDVTTLLTMQIKGYRAWDKRRGIYVRCSNGRRITGRPHRYYAIVQQEFEDYYNPVFREPWQRFCTKDVRIGVTAYTDEEARDKILKRLKGVKR